MKIFVLPRASIKFLFWFSQLFAIMQNVDHALQDSDLQIRVSNRWQSIRVLKSWEITTTQIICYCVKDENQQIKVNRGDQEIKAVSAVQS